MSAMGNPKRGLGDRRQIRLIGSRAFITPTFDGYLLITPEPQLNELPPV